MTKYKYTDEQLREAVASNVSMLATIKALGARQGGGTFSHLRRRIERLELDTSHFKGQAYLKGIISSQKKSWQQICTLKTQGVARTKTEQLRRAMLEYGLELKCSYEDCPTRSLTSWRGSTIVFHVDHINGNWLDDRIFNLRFLCPNCHSLEETTKIRKK